MNSTVVIDGGRVGSFFTALFGTDQYKAELAAFDSPTWEYYVPAPAASMDCDTFTNNQATCLINVQDWKQRGLRAVPEAAARAFAIALKFTDRAAAYQPFIDKCAADLLAAQTGEGTQPGAGTPAGTQSGSIAKPLIIGGLILGAVWYAKKKKLFKK